MASMEVVRVVLDRLIAESNSKYTSEGILREFRATSDKRSPNSKLVEILSSISKHRDNHADFLSHFIKVLNSKDPMFALLVFVDHFSDEVNSSTMLTTASPDQLGLTHKKQPANGSAPFGTDFPSKSGQKSQQDSTMKLLAATTSGTDYMCDVLRDMKKLQTQDFPTSTPMTSRRCNDLDELLDMPELPLGAIKKTASNNRSSCSSELKSIKERVLSAVSDPTQRSSGLTSTPSSRCGGSGSPFGVTDEHRTTSLWDFYKVEGCTAPDMTDMQGMPINAQERTLLREILYFLTGCRTSNIVPADCDPERDSESILRTFTINKKMDKSLYQIAEEIVPLAGYFVGIQRIIDMMDNKGQVANALNAALTQMSTDFILLLCSIEQELKLERLTMQKLFYYLRPTIAVMQEVWSSVVELESNELRGGNVLSHLCNRISLAEGNDEAQKMLIFLTRKAAVPYMRMLQLWIEKGIIVDRNNEFMIKDNEKELNDLPEHYSADYWEKRYTVVSEHTPIFLERYEDKILRTGKYLNVIRQCGKRVITLKTMDLFYEPTSDQHAFVLQEAYQYATRMLLEVLLTENDLMGHLQSVRRYLLLHQGDFTMQFMDACEDELSKNVDQVLPMTLENLLGLTLRLSSARSDPYKDDLHCELLTYDLVTQMSKIMNKEDEYWHTHDRLELNGIECFAFTYEVKWPVSLVLNHIAISKYQMLFRQLFYCKHVERQLCKIWKENAITKKFSPQAAEQYRAAFTLRQRMMNAIQNLEYYMLIEIIDPNWHIFIEKMKKAENVDMVLALHNDFLDSCLKNCMLNESSHLNRGIFKLCKISLSFCEFIQRSQRFFLDAELKSMVCDSNDENTESSDTEQDSSSRQQCESILDNADTFAERVKRFDLEFTGLLISFLKNINDLAKENTADRFLNLVHRINFNSFYTDQIDKLCAKKAMG